jgi:hypothetical protein
MKTNVQARIGYDAGRRRLILALGRGQSGKTLWSRWLVEAMRARGMRPVAVDADGITHGLSRDDEDAVTLGGELVAYRSWWKAALANGEEFAGRPVVVDLSPDTSLVRRVDPEGTDFAGRYAALGFDVTKAFFFGPDVGDAFTFMKVGAGVTAGTTLLVLNEGAIGSRKPERFEAVLAHPAVREAVERGARVARMPELHLDLGRVSEIGNFTAFAGGDRDEAKPLSFEQHAVRTWLTRMEEAFAAFRRELALE